VDAAAAMPESRRAACPLPRTWNKYLESFN
jgi:hypothetical protein